MNKLIKDTLMPLGIPVSFQVHEGEESLYITFFEYLGQGEEWADDEEVAEGHYIQIDVWSKGNYKATVKQAKDLLKAAGFRRTSEAELYDEPKKMYHKVIRVFKEISI